MASKFFSDALSNAGGRCEYCGKSLLDNFDVFWTSQEDHLDPSSDRSSENIVIACNVCNNLKSNYKPNGKNRQEKIGDARRYIFTKRAEKMEDFLSWKVKLQ